MQNVVKISLIIVTLFLLGSFVLLNAWIAQEIEITKTSNENIRGDSTQPEEEQLPSSLPITETILPQDDFGPTKIINEVKEAINNIIPIKQEEREKIPQSELYDITLERLVNLLCDNGKETVIVSGFIISPAGHILTNAHASDHEGIERCQVRKGSPARTFAYAEQVFKPKAYIEATDLAEKAENDISVWKISGSSGSDPLPSFFPYFDILPEEKVKKGEVLVALSYPSELLGLETILKNLNILFTQTTVEDTDGTFILSSGTLSSQSGSSGGVILSQYTANPVGIIFAVEKEEEISKRLLYSLTTQRINDIIEKETYLSISQFLLVN